jgi:hypothetical protein
MNPRLTNAVNIAIAAFALGLFGGGIAWMVAGGASMLAGGAAQVPLAVLAGILSPISVGAVIGLGTLAVYKVRQIVDRRRANALAPALAPGVGGGANLAIEPQAPEQAPHVAVPQVPLQEQVELPIQHPMPQRRLYRSASLPLESARVPLARKTRAMRERGLSI